MGHLDQRILDALLNHRLSPGDIGKLKEHIAACRECSRQIEEWRDQFPAVESVIPTVERSTIHAPQRSGPVQILLPWHQRRGSRREITRYLLPLGILIAMGVVLVARRIYRAPVATGPASIRLTERVNTPGITNPAFEAPMPAPIAAPPTSKSVTPTPPDRPATDKPRPAPKASAAAPGKTEPKDSTSRPPEPRPFTETPKPPVVSSAPGFRPVGIAEAERALDGPVRLVEGWTPVRIELGDGATVPGADTTQPVVRVVYLDGRVLLDQQVSTAPISDTLAGSTPRGVTVLRWTYNRRWLSLAGVLSRDSLDAILRRVH